MRHDTNSTARESASVQTVCCNGPSLSRLIMHGLAVFVLLAACAPVRSAPTSTTSPAMDVAFHGACSSDILYHCSHILTEHQKQIVHGALESTKATAGGSTQAQRLATAAAAASTTTTLELQEQDSGFRGSNRARDTIFSDGATVGQAATVTDAIHAVELASRGNPAKTTPSSTDNSDMSVDAGGSNPTAVTVQQAAEQVTLDASDSAASFTETQFISEDDDDISESAMRAVDEDAEDLLDQADAEASIADGETNEAASVGGDAGSSDPGAATSNVQGDPLEEVGGGGEEVTDGDDADDIFTAGHERRTAELEPAAAGRQEDVSFPELQRTLRQLKAHTAASTRPVGGRRRLHTSTRGGKQILASGPGYERLRAGQNNEAAQLISQQSSLPAVLKRFGLDDAPVRDLAAANAPVARCLRSAIHEGLRSLLPDAPHIGADCKVEVRNFFIDRATDIRRDLPLLASCAYNIQTRCANVTDSGRVIGCLKATKPRLLSICRAAVTTHQIESSEDISLDPDLAAACGADRERLCSDVGWGEGAAQACLLSYLPPAADPSRLPSNQDRTAAVVSGQAGVSASCDAALFQRQMDNSEDIRFSYDLASACSIDKQVLCRDVHPGRAGILGCLERQFLQDPQNLDVACRSAMAEQQRLHAYDARLDYHFRTHCGADVQALCSPGEAALLSNASAPRGSGGAVLECVRSQQPRIRNVECKKYLFEVAMAMYQDNTLDARLQAVCASDLRQRCRDPSTAIPCLKDSMRKYGDIDFQCSALVNHRLEEAASDLAFNPQLRQACAAERLEFCSASHLQGPAVIDCLADNRRENEFGEGCREALLEYLQEAVSDIRMMHSLRSQCRSDIVHLCGGVVPGEGRVVGCLQQKREQIKSRGCRAQILRLLGFVVEDARLDFRLMQACRADAQQFCAGVRGGDGRMHACLRRSWDHLSPGCKEAEAKVEAMEHEDVRLNPQLQNEVMPGDANVISCLLNNMAKPTFPTECKDVLLKLLDRSAVRYSLNAKLKKACDADAVKLCAWASDDPETGMQVSTLSCLAGNSTVVQPACRAEIVGTVKLQLTRYRMGMPLTSACDGDVMTLCNVDMLTATFLERGYIQSCLVKHVSRLHAPCFALISMFDDRQYEHAIEVEQHWKGGMGDEQLQKVAAEVRKELEPHLLDHMSVQVADKVKQQHGLLTPRIDALLNSVAVLLVLVLVAASISVFFLRKRRGSFVIKNASQ